MKQELIRTNWREIEQTIKKESIAEDCILSYRDRILKGEQK